LVIRAYNEAAHIGRLLDGLSRQTFYYPHGMEMPDQPMARKVEPIQYKE
jgi:hypothetical protein